MNRFEACLKQVQETRMANAAYEIPPKHKTRISSGVCCPKPATQPASVKLEDISARRIDMHALRRSMPDRWSQFCRTHFRNSIELAAFFGTDERTARFWLEGKYAPNASVALRAVTSFPDAIDCLMEGDC